MSMNGRGTSPQRDAAPAPPQPPPPQKPKSERMRSQSMVGFIEMLKLLDWFTEVLKILCNEPAGRAYWFWVCFTLCTASFLLLQRMFDQIFLVMKAARWQAMTKFCLCLLTLPLTLVLAPLSTLTLSLYNIRMSKEQREKDLTIFAQRPMSTMMMGLPVYGVVSAFQSDPALVMHPVQGQLRAVQSLYQFLLEDIACFVVDMVVIMNAPADKDVTFFWASFVFSVTLSLAVCLFTVKEIDQLERPKPEPVLTGPHTGLPAIMDQPSFHWAPSAA